MLLMLSVFQAKTPKDAAEGLSFMREISKSNALSDIDNGIIPMGVKINENVITAGPGHFGKEIKPGDRFTFNVAYAQPFHACAPLTNAEELEGKFGVAQRGDCTFVQKARHLGAAGATLAIIVDNNKDSSCEKSTFFAMSGDGVNNVKIPAVFLFASEAEHLAQALKDNPNLDVVIGELKSMQEEFIDGGAIDSEGSDDKLGTLPDKKESTDHLKQVLNQLVTQFELSMSNEDGSGCGHKKPTIYEINEQVTKARYNQRLKKEAESTDDTKPKDENIILEDPKDSDDL